MYAAIPAFLVLMEPDFGSAAVILCLWLGMVFLSPINKKYILGLLAIAFLAAIASWNFLLKDFQKNRIRVFFWIRKGTQGQGYNVRQAVVAVGSGGLWGKGLGLGSQSQNRFLPERQTDFIFAASAEQIGLFGTGAVLGLFLFLHARLINIMQKSRDSFGLYAAAAAYFFKPHPHACQHWYEYRTFACNRHSLAVFISRRQFFYYANDSAGHSPKYIPPV